MMNSGNLRLRRLTRGVIPELFQGPSSAGAQRYPGDRAFFDDGRTTVQIHMLRIQEGEHEWSNVPAVAVRLIDQTGLLIHDE